MPMFKLLPIKMPTPKLLKLKKMGRIKMILMTTMMIIIIMILIIQ